MSRFESQSVKNICQGDLEMKEYTEGKTFKNGNKPHSQYRNCKRFHAGKLS